MKVIQVISYPKQNKVQDTSTFVTLFQLLYISYLGTIETSSSSNVFTQRSMFLPWFGNLFPLIKIVKILTGDWIGSKMAVGLTALLCYQSLCVTGQTERSSTSPGARRSLLHDVTHLYSFQTTLTMSPTNNHFIDLKILKLCYV